MDIFGDKNNENKSENKCDTCGHVKRNYIVNIELWRTKNRNIRGSAMLGVKNDEEALAVITYLSQALNETSKSLMRNKFGANLAGSGVSVTKEQFDEFKRTGKISDLVGDKALSDMIDKLGDKKKNSEKDDGCIF